MRELKDRGLHLQESVPCLYLSKYTLLKFASILLLEYSKKYRQ